MGVSVCTQVCGDLDFPLQNFGMGVGGLLPPRWFPRQAMETADPLQAGGRRSSSKAAFQFLPSCCLPGEAGRGEGGTFPQRSPTPLAQMGLTLSHGLGISVSLADEHLQEPQFCLNVLILVVFFGHWSAVFLLDISNGNKEKRG